MYQVYKLKWKEIKLNLFKIKTSIIMTDKLIRIKTRSYQFKFNSSSTTGTLNNQLHHKLYVQYVWNRFWMTN